MASFCNQSSNLSALRSSLRSFTDILDVPDQSLSRLTSVEHRENVEIFFDNQQERLEYIDDSLLRATEDILPPCPEAKTITEVAELCRLVQEATRQKMGLLRTRLELLGVKTSWEDSITSPKPVATIGKGTAEIHWSIGGPLDCVIEGDVETEGATTPGSMIQPSPFSTTKSSRKTSLTPTTPKLNKFSFSSNTASILEKMNDQLTSSHSKRQTPTSNKSRAAAPRLPSPASALRSQFDKQLNFDGFQEDDDMISLNTTLERHSYSGTTSTKPTLKSPSLKMPEEREQFLRRMESMLERVEEELTYEARPSDEASRRSSQNRLKIEKPDRPSDEVSLAPGKSVANLERPSNNKFLEELQEEDEEANCSTDDDSTNVIATLVAEKPEPANPNIMRPIPVFRRPTQIVIDTGGMASPAHTNITMDGTMMNDTMISNSVMMQTDDNDSTVTPVLDRYRLDPDDNSIGIKVVPNRRRGHPDDRSTDFRDDVKITEFSTDSDGFTSPKGLPGTVSARKPKHYRKTPFTKKQLEQSFDDENNPNVKTALAFSPASSTTSFDASNPESSFSVPPLRPRSFGPTRSSSRRKNTSCRTQSLPAQSAGLPQTPVQQTSPGNDLIEKITRAEYNNAPRIVQAQVTREDANQAIQVLEEYLQAKQQQMKPMEFSDDDGYHLLSSIADSEQRCKSILMSLCHWKRLLMYREGGNKMAFAINQF